MEIMNRARGFAHLYGVLRGQQADPYCRGCNGFASTLNAARESLDAFRREQAGPLADLPLEFGRLLDEARAGLAAMPAPGQTVGQKKAGKCQLPEGRCFCKSALAFVQAR
ncbi:MAG: hypothetical protein M0042_00135 [Nitrospiraceae bacterium]|nr:hypothetical protein [Nitrospiraceae bacterium]